MKPFSYPFQLRKTQKQYNSKALGVVWDKTIESYHRQFMYNYYNHATMLLDYTS